MPPETTPECHGQVGDRHEPVEMELESSTPPGYTFRCPECETDVVL